MIQRVTDAVSFFSVQKSDQNEFSDDQVLRLMGSGCSTAVATGLPIRRGTRFIPRNIYSPKKIREIYLERSVQLLEC